MVFYQRCTVVVTESRTPRRLEIPRDENGCITPVRKNLLSCGEGAGYAEASLVLLWMEELLHDRTNFYIPL